MPKTPCPEGMTRNAATKECREKKKPGRAAREPCPEGTVRNAATKECREKKKPGRRPKAVAPAFAPDLAHDLGLSKFVVRGKRWDARAGVYRGVLNPLDKHPLPWWDLKDVIYDRNADLDGVYRQARAVAKNMFGKENNVRSVMEMLFYVPKKDIFIVVLRTRSESEPKVIKNNDYLGVEFKFELFAKHSVVMNQEAIVLLQSSGMKVKDPALVTELLNKVVAEHPSAVMLVK